MKLEYFNCPQPEEFNGALLKEVPPFLSYKPDFKLMADLADEFSKYKNVLVIGHGGSISTIWGIYNALMHEATKSFYTLCTVDPDYITELKKTLTPENTVVVAVSKSGETVTQIEALLQFTDFPLVVVAGSMGPLREMAEELGAKVVQHPPLSGRYSGFSEVALVPAALCGLDIEAMYAGAQKVYQQYQQNNDAYQAASVMQQLEDRGFVDVFMPIYDWHFYSLNSLVIQLCHESFGKDGQGQTYFAHHAPESQHHSNQRFLGGRRNMAGWFIATDKPLHDLTTKVPDNLKNLTLKDKTLAALDSIPLSYSLNAELNGTLEDAKLQNIPVVYQHMPERTATEVGTFIGFWHLFAVYSSLLRNVDPFNQPQVENSKKISFAKRLQYKGLL